MATNLISLANQFLTPDIIAKIASFLGLDRSIAKRRLVARSPDSYPCWPRWPPPPTARASSAML